MAVALSRRNLGINVRGANSEGERGALEFRGERGGEWGGSIPSSSDSGVCESVVSSPSRKRLQIASVDSR